MARSVTLFTGQWADLPLAELAPKAKQFGFDGLELACWGDHLDVDRAAVDQEYCDGRHALLAEHGLGCWAISHHLAGQLVCDPNDARSDAFAPEAVHGAPEAKRAWAIETMKNTARAARNLGLTVVCGFTGSPIWHLLYSFPPVSEESIEAGYRRFRRAVAPDSRRVRRVRGAVRPRGASHRDRLRHRERPSGPRRGRPARGVRLQLRPQPPAVAGDGAGPVHRRVSPTASTTCT